MINRKEIKRKAWEISKKNMKLIWLSYGFVAILFFAIDTLCSRINITFPKCVLNIFGTCVYSVGSIMSFSLSTILSVFISFLICGQCNILMNIVRKKDADFNDLFKYKSSCLKIFAMALLIKLLISLGALLIIPGIILQLCYSFVYYMYIDNNEDLNIKESLRKSRKLIYGYKLDYLFFCFSFIGWILLGALTLGIAYIWVIPFMLVSDALYYEELKSIKMSEKELTK